MQKVKFCVEEMISNTINEIRILDTPFKKEPRCSSLSKFCQIATLIPLIENKLEQESCMQDFYCEIGTAVHSVMQKWMGVKNYLYGLWECPKCRSIQEGFSPKKCCNKLCIYKEYSLNWRGISGHCDGIISIDSLFYILEFKTISLKGLKEREELKRPYYFHSNQVNMYLLMAQKLKLPNPLVGSVIVYIARDNPNKFAVFPKTGIDLDTVNLTYKLYKEMIEMLETRNITNIVKSCNTIKDAYYCPYKSLCFKGNIKDYLRNLWKLYEEKK